MYRQERDRDIVEDLGNRRPERQRRNVFGVQRYNHGIAGLDRLCRGTEPAGTGVGHDAAIRAHHLRAAVVGAAGLATTHGDVVVTCQSRAPQVRGHRLHLADHRDLLPQLRHDEVIPVTQHDVVL